MNLLILFVIIAVLLQYTLYWKALDLSKLYNNSTIYFGHRGLRQKAPENTIDSYKAAIEKGLTALELDVRITNDGKLICSHNLDLERETQGRGFVDDMNSEELIKVKAGRDFTEDERSEIPLLEEVTQKLPNDILLNIEIKSVSFFDLAAAKVLIQMIEEGKIKQSIIVSSFNPLVVRYIKFKTKTVPTGYIYEYAKYFIGVFLARPDCLHPDAEFIDDNLVKFCRKRNIRINTWTVNNIYAKDWLVGKGINGIITDNPKIAN